MANPWFEASKDGLRKLLAKRGKAFAVIELIQNAFDEDTTRVDVHLSRSNMRGKYLLEVEDDNPEGFKDLSHAYTLFAESEKKDDPTKRGRFNLGEKLVLALCDSASIESTKGAIHFTSKGRQKRRVKRERGSKFTAILPMNQHDADEVAKAVYSLIVPEEISLHYNRQLVPHRTPIRTVEATLPTLRSDAEGNLSPTRRNTTVEIYSSGRAGEGRVYELGLPVVETGDRYDVNVCQKVPLNMNRDNVTPAYLRELRTVVLNATHDLLTSEEATATWVKVALEDDDVEDAAVAATVNKLYGAKRVSFDPSDPEANKLAVSQGYTVIPGKGFSRKAWANIKRAKAVRPAGQVTPSPRPYGEDGSPLITVDPEEWTDGQKLIVAYAELLARELLDREIKVELANDPALHAMATYGPSHTLVFNIRYLGKAWFEMGINQHITALIIHEFGHEYCSDHLSERYYDALCNLGAQLHDLTLTKPEIFNPFYAGGKD